MYKSPRRYILTPSRKRLGKAVARKFNRSIIEECLAHEGIKKHLLQKLTQLLRREIVLEDIELSALNSYFDSESRAELLHKYQWYQSRSFVEFWSWYSLARCIMVGEHGQLIHQPPLKTILSLVLYAGHSEKQKYV